MKARKIKNEDLDIKVPKKGAFTIETPSDQLRLHQLQCISATRGTGKGVIGSSWFQSLKRQNCMDRIFMMSPTSISNEEIFRPLNIDPDDVYPNGEKESIQDIIRKCEEEMDDWEEYQEAMLLYKLLNDSSIDINRIKPELLLKALEKGYFSKPPESKYGHRPILGLIVDDLQGSNIYNTNPKNPFINLLLRHRHLARGLGITVCMMVQTYAGAGGVPRIVRQNITSLLLGPQKNEKVIEQIADEVGGQIQHDDFMKAYEIATHNDHPDKPNHNFLLIDFHPKSPEKMFRRNLNTYIY
jgi:hypothetical protein